MAVYMIEETGIDSYKAVLTIEKGTADFLRKILTEEPDSEENCMGEDETISHTVTFPNGYEMDIKCCGVEYDEDNRSNLPWTEAVLFKDGRQVDCSEPSEDYFGKWKLEADNLTFTVVVESED